MEDVARSRGLYRWWILAALWAAAIFVVSSIPGQSIPGPEVEGLDKVAHFGEFGLLAAFLALAWRRAGPAAVLAIVWGILDEFHQHFTPYRTVSVYDALADAMGAACGAGLVLWLLARRRRSHGDRS